MYMGTEPTCMMKDGTVETFGTEKRERMHLGEKRGNDCLGPLKMKCVTGQWGRNEHHDFSVLRAQGGVMIRGGTIRIPLVPYDLLPVNFEMAKCGVGLLEVTFT